MFEDRTYESLLKEKLDKVDKGYDKREGSVIYDAMAPNSAEAAQIYIFLEWILEQMFGDTAQREYLIKIAMDTRGMKPKEATCAVLKGYFDIAVPIGSRFNIGAINYCVQSAISEQEFTYAVECETAGTEGNRHFGSMIPIEFIDGLSKAELKELLIPGEEAEGTEEFRKRWRESFKSLSFSGNKADYKEKIKNITGVGGVKIIRAAGNTGEKKGGHVCCIVQTSEFTCPSAELLNSIQTKIDPLGNAGEGDGLAPIGHEVHIVGVKEQTVDVDSTITYATGYVFEDIRSYIEKAIEDYLMELNMGWENSEKIVVRISQIESRVLSVAGVVDIRSTKLNGVESNAELDSDEIAIRGNVNG